MDVFLSLLLFFNKYFRVRFYFNGLAIYRAEKSLYISFMIIQFSCPCGTDKLDFILLSQFIKIVNICAKTHKNGRKINVDCKWSSKCESITRFSISGIAIHVEGLIVGALIHERK